MKIIIDVEIGQDGNIVGTQYVDTDPQTQINHPTLGVISVLNFLSWLNADKSRLDGAGFNTPTKIPGHPAGTTRWQVLVRQANAAGDPTLKSLNLT